MSKKDQVNPTVVTETVEVNNQGTVNPEPNTEEQIAKVEPKTEKLDKETFKSQLEAKKITVGTKVSYTVSGSEEPTEIVVDDAFLSLPIQELEYYEKYNYKIVK